PKGAKPWRMQERCPACDSQLVREEGEAVRRCLNPLCPAQRREKLLHFASRAALNIEGLGPAVIDQLIEHGYVNEPGDLFTVTKEQVLTLDGTDVGAHWNTRFDDASRGGGAHPDPWRQPRIQRVAQDARGRGGGVPGEQDGAGAASRCARARRARLPRGTRRSRGDDAVVGTVESVATSRRAERLIDDPDL